MQFPQPLTRGTLVRRYKRFLSDIALGEEIVTAHCANPGAMIGLTRPGSEVWLAPNANPKAKLPWRWELIRLDSGLVGVNTALPNRLVEEALDAQAVPELAGYAGWRREVRYGENSRIDLLLEHPERPPCYVEVKSVNVRRDLRGRERAAEFPDAVTKRGAKHLAELARMAESGCRAVMLYLVQRGDCDHFRVAEDIDPTYAAALDDAVSRGVEALCYACTVAVGDISVAAPLPVRR